MKAQHATFLQFGVQDVLGEHEGTRLGQGLIRIGYPVTGVMQPLESDRRLRDGLLLFVIIVPDLGARCETGRQAVHVTLFNRLELFTYEDEPIDTLRRARFSVHARRSRALQSAWPLPGRHRTDSPAG